MLGTWPFVGREDELELIARVMQRGGHQAIVLTGRAGVGKSRLAAEAVAAAQSRGWAMVRVIATAAAASIPFGALGHLLPPSEGCPADALEVLRLVRRILAQRAGVASQVILVDDAHLLDDASASLLLQLAVDRTAFVLVTVCSGEETPDAIVSLWKEGLGPQLEVAELSAERVTELVTQVLQGHVDGATLHDLLQVTSGNLLYLREVIQSGIASGRLGHTEGVWRWRGPIAPPGAVRGLIGERLARVSSAERQLVDALAIGQPLEVGTLRAFGSVHTMAVAETAGLVTAWDEGRRTYVGLAHPQYTEVLRSAIGPLRRRELCLLLAQGVDSTGARRRDDLVRLASWRLDGGGRQSSATLEVAATQALAVGDFHSAERLARAALDGDGGFTSRFVLSQALMGQKRPQEAEGVLAATVATSDAEAVRLAAMRAPNLLWGLGRIDEAEEILRGADGIVADPILHDGLEASRALALLCLGRPLEAVATASTVVDGREATGPAAMLALAVTAACHASMGHTRDALATTERAFTALPAHPDGRLAGRGQVRLIEWFSLLMDGQVAQSEELAVHEYDRAVTARSDRARAMSSFQIGITALVRGRVRTACGWLREACVLGRVHDPARTLVLALASLAEATALSGDPAEANAILSDAALLDGSVLPHEESWLAVSRAWVTAAAGDVAGARALARRAAGVAAEQGFTAMEALGLHCGARLGDAAAAERLARVAGGLQGDLFAAMASQATALLTRDGASLDGVADRFESMNTLLWAAEVCSDAARAHQRAGAMGMSRCSQTRATRLAARCEGAMTPTLRRTGLPDALTAREQDIARLAAGGLTSVQIAQSLAVATRTVENNLHRIYSKLGVPNRRALAGALRLPAVDP